MKRIRLEVPDEWPEDFRRYNQALKLIEGRPGISPRDTLSTFKLIGGLHMSPWQVPSFRAWAAIRGWQDAQQIVDDLAADREPDSRERFYREEARREADTPESIEELNAVRALKAAIEETPL